MYIKEVIFMKHRRGGSNLPRQAKRSWLRDIQSQPENYIPGIEGSSLRGGLRITLKVNKFPKSGIPIPKPEARSNLPKVPAD
jgi:hypothetical protein